MQRDPALAIVLTGEFLDGYVLFFMFIEQTNITVKTSMTYTLHLSGTNSDDIF
jgi:hypothetical protein